jgi:hypothetical protein
MFNNTLFLNSGLNTFNFKEVHLLKWTVSKILAVVGQNLLFVWLN